MSNIFSVIISVLDTVTVSGHENIAKMNGVFGMLRELEAAANNQEESEQSSEVTDDG